LFEGRRGQQPVFFGYTGRLATRPGTTSGITGQGYCVRHGSLQVGSSSVRGRVTLALAAADEDGNVYGPMHARDRCCEGRHGQCGARSYVWWIVVVVAVVIVVVVVVVQVVAGAGRGIRSMSVTPPLPLPSTAMCISAICAAAVGTYGSTVRRTK